MPLTPADIAKTNSESAHQKALFAQAAIFIPQYPQLRWLHAIPNGGLRDIKTAARMKAEGSKAGVLDVFFPYPNGGYHGLYIEMKAPGKLKNVSDLQIEFIEFAREQEYKVVLADNWKDAWDFIIEYLHY